MNSNKKIAAFVKENDADLIALGLFFCRLLRADSCVMSASPSPILAAVMLLSQKGKLGTRKPIELIIDELETTGEELLADGFNGAILRL